MKRCVSLIPVIISAWLFAACSTPSPASQSPAHASVHGRVIYSGPEPTISVIRVPPILDDVFPDGLSYTNLLVGPDSGLAETVVYVVNPPARHSLAAVPPAGLLVSNTVCYPRVLAIQTNQDVRFHFTGRQLLNVNATPRINRGFNFAVAADGQENLKRFPLPELGIPIADNYHPWLVARIAVFDYPWFAVTDAQGRFELPPLPPGDYELSAWHPRLGTNSQVVAVSDHPVTADFIMSKSVEQASR